jgi:hypothetical protein
MYYKTEIMYQIDVCNFFYMCLLEDAVCSEMQDEDTVERGALS